MVSVREIIGAGELKRGMDIRLNYLNLSGDAGRSQVVIFQKDLFSKENKPVLAWKVIRFCGYGCHHPFVYTTELTVSAGLYPGNHTLPQRIEAGSRLGLHRTVSGLELLSEGRGPPIYDVQVVNRLSRGAMGVTVYRAGLPLASKTGIAPGQNACFRFRPRISIGVVDDWIDQGEAIHPAVVAGVKTEIPVIGFFAADIVMTGGGPGPDSRAYAFHLEKAEVF